MAALTLLQWCSLLFLCLVISATKLRVVGCFGVCFFSGHGFFMTRTVWLLMSTGAVAKLCTFQRCVKQLDPDVLWPPLFLSLSYPLYYKPSRVWLRPIGLFLCHLGTLQSLAPHTSALAPCQRKLISSINISVPCPQVKV